jgi:hypothetical protein
VASLLAGPKEPLEHPPFKVTEDPGQVSDEAGAQAAPQENPVPPAPSG